MPASDSFSHNKFKFFNSTELTKECLLFQVSPIREESWKDDTQFNEKNNSDILHCFGSFGGSTPLLNFRNVLKKIHVMKAKWYIFLLDL